MEVMYYQNIKKMERENGMAERELLAWTVSHDNGSWVNVREDESSSSQL